MGAGLEPEGTPGQKGGGGAVKASQLYLICLLIKAALCGVCELVRACGRGWWASHPLTGSPRASPRGEYEGGPPWCTGLRETGGVGFPIPACPLPVLWAWRSCFPPL